MNNLSNKNMQVHVVAKLVLGKTIHYITITTIKYTDRFTVVNKIKKICSDKTLHLDTVTATRYP